LTGSYDNFFVLSEWFLETPRVLFNDQYKSNGRWFESCKNWEELLNGVTPGSKPQLSILYPTHSQFEMFDVLVVCSKDGENKSLYGYRLKESTHFIETGFWLSGKSLQDDHMKWNCADKEAMDSFYGVSGK